MYKLGAYGPYPVCFRDGNIMIEVCIIVMYFVLDIEW